MGQLFSLFRRDPRPMDRFFGRGSIGRIAICGRRLVDRQSSENDGNHVGFDQFGHAAHVDTKRDLLFLREFP